MNNAPKTASTVLMLWKASRISQGIGAVIILPSILLSWLCIWGFVAAEFANLLLFAIFAGAGFLAASIVLSIIKKVVHRKTLAVSADDSLNNY